MHVRRDDGNTFAMLVDGDDVVSVVSGFDGGKHNHKRDEQLTESWACLVMCEK